MNKELLKSVLIALAVVYLSNRVAFVKGIVGPV